ncbi:MAG: hypothetical protein D3917_20675, partial [Candidatus Electrothrix sp. AX5]|nr:hypothetical protein [Candidatus Electrothrix sp. AX5]
EFWNALSEAQQALLRAVAEEREPSEEEKGGAALLVRKEILAQEGSGWVFRVPLICRWILGGLQCGL